MPEAELSKGSAITSMVLGIISIPTSFIPFVGLVLGILAIIFYAKANKLIKNEPKKYGGHGMAIAGLVTGIIGVIFGTLYLIYWVFIGSVFLSLLPLFYE